MPPPPVKLLNPRCSNLSPPNLQKNNPNQNQSPDSSRGRGIFFNNFAQIQCANKITQAAQTGSYNIVDFAPLQVGVGFFDKWQLYDGNAHSFVSVGILGLMQKSAVTSFAPINMLKKNYFLQCGFLTSATEENYFFSFALFNATHKNCGLQLGAGNISASDWGIQVGLVNLGPQIQIGAYNIDGQIQIGILNAHGKIQIGLLNYNRNSYIPWLPFINWDMGKKE